VNRTTISREIVILLTVIVLLLGIAVPVKAADEAAIPDDFAIGVPSAKTSVPDLVPFEVVRKIALHTAKERWGTVNPGIPIPCSDEDGSIVAYMWPFRIGKELFPGYHEIMQGLKKGRALAGQIEHGSFQETFSGEQVFPGTPNGTAAQENAGEKTGLSPGSGPSATAIPKQESAAQSVSQKEMLVRAKMMAIGSGEYGTVYVSARYDEFPVPLVSYYLSPYYTTGDLAVGEAQKALQTTAPAVMRLVRYYFLGRRGQYFEFDSGAGSVRVHAQSLEIEHKSFRKKAAVSEKRRQDFRRAWSELLKAAEGGN
jgi:hypothetical protein